MSDTLRRYVERARAAKRAPGPWQVNGFTLEDFRAGRTIRDTSND